MREGKHRVFRDEIAALVRERCERISERDDLTIRQRVDLVIFGEANLARFDLEAPQRGFAVAEVLVSLLISIVVGLVALSALQMLTRTVFMRSSSEGGTVTLEQEIESMRGDASTAFAVFVPQTDVFHAYNAATPGAGIIPTGHEVDFYSRTDTGLESWWAYFYDEKAHTLQRYDYDTMGNVGVADRNSGAIDSKAHYPSLLGVHDFSADVLEASQLSSPANELGPLLSQLFVGSGRRARAEPVGFVPASGLVRPDLYGGNVTVRVTLSTNAGLRTLHLSSATLPSGFTIHETPSIRAVTYRIDIVHRFWFGFAQITHSQIFNQLLYSYDPFAPPASWHVWCDWELYGSGIAGLRIGDPSGNYHATNFNESAAGIYYAVTATTSNGENGTTRLNEQPGCHRPVPAPGANLPPTVTQSNPDVVDTPPPCFVRGRCWPMNAPINYTPPSPWPKSAPPSPWCAIHQGSPLCGGVGGTPVPTYDAPSRIYYYVPSAASEFHSAPAIYQTSMPNRANGQE